MSGQGWGGSWHDEHYDPEGNYIGPDWPQDMAHHLTSNPVQAPYNAGYHAARHPAFVDSRDPMGEAESAWSNAGGPTISPVDFSTFEDGWEDSVNGIPHMWLQPEAHKAYLERGDDLRRFDPKRRREHAESVRSGTVPYTDPDEHVDPFDPRIIGASRVDDPNPVECPECGGEGYVNPAHSDGRCFDCGHHWQHDVDEHQDPFDPRIIGASLEDPDQLRLFTPVPVEPDPRWRGNTILCRNCGRPKTHHGYGRSFGPCPTNADNRGVLPPTRFQAGLHTARDVPEGEDWEAEERRLERHMRDNPELYEAANYPFDELGSYNGTRWPEDLSHHLHADPGIASYNAGYAVYQHPAFADHDSPLHAAKEAWYQAGGRDLNPQNGTSFEDGYLDAEGEIPHRFRDAEGYEGWRAERGEEMPNPVGDAYADWNPDDKQDPFDPRIIGAGKRANKNDYPPHPAINYKGEHGVCRYCDSDITVHPDGLWRDPHHPRPEVSQFCAEMSSDGPTDRLHEPEDPDYDGNLNGYGEPTDWSGHDPRITGASRRTAGDVVIRPDFPHDDWQERPGGSSILKWHPYIGGDTHAKYHVYPGRRQGGRVLSWRANHHGIYQGLTNIGDFNGSSFTYPKYSNEDDPEHIYDPKNGGRDYRSVEEAKAAARRHFEETYGGPRDIGMQEPTQPSGPRPPDGEDFGYIFGSRRTAGEISGPDHSHEDWQEIYINNDPHNPGSFRWHPAYGESHVRYTVHPRADNWPMDAHSNITWGLRHDGLYQGTQTFHDPSIGGGSITLPMYSHSHSEPIRGFATIDDAKAAAEEHFRQNYPKPSHDYDLSQIDTSPPPPRQRGLGDDEDYGHIFGRLAGWEPRPSEEWSEYHCKSCGEPLAEDPDYGGFWHLDDSGEISHEDVGHHPDVDYTVHGKSKSINQFRHEFRHAYDPDAHPVPDWEDCASCSQFGLPPLRYQDPDDDPDPFDPRGFVASFNPRDLGMSEGRLEDQPRRDDPREEHGYRWRDDPNGMPPNFATGWALHEVPRDNFYHEELPNYVWGLGYKLSPETLSQLQAAQGNPDAPVTIYRAVPHMAIREGMPFNSGDWVTVDRDQAHAHARLPGLMRLNYDMPLSVYQTTVPAKHLFTNGNYDGLTEYGYHGPARHGYRVGPSHRTASTAEWPEDLNQHLEEPTGYSAGYAAYHHPAFAGDWEKAEEAFYVGAGGKGLKFEDGFEDAQNGLPPQLDQVEKRYKPLRDVANQLRQQDHNTLSDMGDLTVDEYGRLTRSEGPSSKHPRGSWEGCPTCSPRHDMASDEYTDPDQDPFDPRIIGASRRTAQDDSLATGCAVCNGPADLHLFRACGAGGDPICSGCWRKHQKKIDVMARNGTKLYCNGCNEIGLPRNHVYAVPLSDDADDYGRGWEPDENVDFNDPRIIGASRVPEEGEDPEFDRVHDEFLRWMSSQYSLSPEAVNEIAYRSQPGGKYEEHGHINEYIKEFLDDPRIRGASRRTASEEAPFFPPCPDCGQVAGFDQHPIDPRVYVCRNCEYPMLEHGLSNLLSRTLQQHDAEVEAIPETDHPTLGKHGQLDYDDIVRLAGEGMSWEDTMAYIDRVIAEGEPGEDFGLALSANPEDFEPMIEHEPITHQRSTCQNCGTGIIKNPFNNVWLSDDHFYSSNCGSGKLHQPTH